MSHVSRKSKFSSSKKFCFCTKLWDLQRQSTIQSHVLKAAVWLRAINRGISVMINFSTHVATPLKQPPSLSLSQNKMWSFWWPYQETSCEMNAAFVDPSHLKPINQCLGNTEASEHVFMCFHTHLKCSLSISATSRSFWRCKQKQWKCSCDVWLTHAASSCLVWGCSSPRWARRCTWQRWSSSLCRTCRWAARCRQRLEAERRNRTIKRLKKNDCYLNTGKSITVGYKEAKVFCWRLGEKSGGRHKYQCGSEVWPPYETIMRLQVSSSLFTAFSQIRWHKHSPMARKLTTHCSTEITCRCFSILDVQNANGRSCRAERMLEPVPEKRGTKNREEKFIKISNTLCEWLFNRK